MPDNTENSYSRPLTMDDLIGDDQPMTKHKDNHRKSNDNSNDQRKYSHTQKIKP